MFFTIVGFLFLLVITFGPALYILHAGYWQSKTGSSYPVGALISAGMFAAMGVVVIYLAPFHIALTP